ncbi:hypothetical protein CRG98_050403 [Punica granatum]|uniref:CCHC-type domain-containing protein n=1 Tax=Punica granatum TaxID=22663 RepID=A0A2I0GBN1_PUNGR|nr:hypothetical protein CRG98_050403 [Punica granatum]
MTRNEDKSADTGKGMQTLAIYKIGASDSTGLQITSCLLNGDNYLTWSRAMRIALTAKGKLGFMEGRVPKPPAEDPNLESWEMCNSLVLAWIFNRLEKELQPSAAYATEAKTFWDDLKERYSQGNEMRIYQLKSDIGSYRQEGKTIQKYYSGIKTLWDELENHLESPGCLCDAVAQYTAQREKEKTYQFLMGLDEQFRGVGSDILRAEPLLSMSKVYQLVSEEEKQHTVARSRDAARTPKGGIEIGAFVARSGSENRQGQRWTAEGKSICDHCGRPGHVKSSCWALHGQPADGNNRGKGKKSGGQGKQTSGQWRGSGQWNGGRSVVANVAQEGPSAALGGGTNQFSRGTRQWTGGNPNSGWAGGNFNSGWAGGNPHSGLSNAVHEGRIPNSMGNSLSGLSNTQFETLLNIIAAHEGRNEPLVSNNNNFISIEGSEWIIDTGALRHMTGCVECLDNLRSIDDKIHIYIPNGNSTRATSTGIVRLGGSFVLQDVLFVPTFNCNWISVGQLSKDMDYFVTFLPELCIIQDRVSKRTVGLGELRRGVYYLGWVASSIMAYQALGVGSGDIWHKRLGHPSSDTPQQNGRVERKHRHILNVARALLFQASLPTRFWGESIATAAYLINIMRIQVLGGKSPYEILFQRKPNYSNLRVFGSLCYAHHRPRDRDKFAERARKCIFIGYPHGKKGWRMYDLEKEDFFVSRDVRFCENDFPFERIGCPIMTNENPLFPNQIWNEEDIEVEGELDDFRDIGERTRLNQTGAVEQMADSPWWNGHSRPDELVGEGAGDAFRNVQFNGLGRMEETGAQSKQPISQSRNSSGPWENLDNVNQFSQNQMQTHPPERPLLQARQTTTQEARQTEIHPDFSIDQITQGGRGVTSRRLGREILAPRHLRDFVDHKNKDFVTHIATHYPPCSLIPPKPSGTPYPIETYLARVVSSNFDLSYLAAIDSDVEPKTYREAVCDPRWRTAMAEEIRALEMNQTRTLAALPLCKRPIDCKWVFKIKRRADGEVKRYKARLVAKGFTQVEGIDFHETFAPVAKLVTVQCLLTVAVAKGWEMYQMDVQNAFLHGNLDEEVYETAIRFLFA